MLVHPTQPVEIFGNISTAFGTLKVPNAVEILPKNSTEFCMALKYMLIQAVHILKN